MSKTTRPLPRTYRQHRTLSLLALRPLSTRDLMDNGVGKRGTCVDCLVHLKSIGAVVEVCQIGNAIYYRTKGFETTRDKATAAEWHADRKRRQASGDRLKLEVDERTMAAIESALLEDRLRGMARTKARAIKPFRCPMTVAFFGPYVSHGRAGIPLAKDLPPGTCEACEGDGEQGGQFCGGCWTCETCGGTGKFPNA